MTSEPRKAYEISVYEVAQFIKSYTHAELLSAPLESFPLEFRFLLHIYRNAILAPRPVAVSAHAAVEAALRFHRSLRNELLRCTQSDGELRKQAFMRMHQLCIKYKIVHPQLCFKMKGTSAGDALDDRIRLNPILFRENVDETLQQTLPHELCHVWKDQLKLPGSSHGKEWQNLMRRMGVKPDRCHNMDVTRARVRINRIHLYGCGCPKAGHVTARRHRQIQDTELYRPVSCLRCGKPVQYLGIEKSLNQPQKQTA
jgi:SprT protein